MKLFLMLAIMSLFSSCDYLSMRGRDFADIFTLSVEEGHANLGLQVAPIHTGIGLSKGRGWGLRSGVCGEYEYEEINLLILSHRKFEPKKQESNRYEYTSALLLSTACMIASEEYAKGWFDDEDFLAKDELSLKEGKYWPIFFQIEASLCLYRGLRAGINLAELLDFVLGWTTWDICKDDISDVSPEQVAENQSDDHSSEIKSDSQEHQK